MSFPTEEESRAHARVVAVHLDTLISLKIDVMIAVQLTQIFSSSLVSVMFAGVAQKQSAAADAKKTPEQSSAG